MEIYNKKLKVIKLNYLTLKNISKSYNKDLILKDINIDIDLKNRFIYSLIGPNGAGKTTLMKVLGGILYANKGEIFLDDKKLYIESYSQWAKENAIYLPAGERSLNTRNSGYDNAIFIGLLKGENKDILEQRIKKYSSDLNLGDIIYKPIEELSTGQLKKIQILVALSSNRKLILLDEPSIGLDIYGTEELKDVIKNILINEDKTIIISSHDINLLVEMTDRAIFVFNGKIINNVNQKLSYENIKELYFQYKYERRVFS